MYDFNCLEPGKLQQLWGSLSYQVIKSEQLINFCRLTSNLTELTTAYSLTRIVSQICGDSPWGCQVRVRRAYWEVLPA